MSTSTDNVSPTELAIVTAAIDSILAANTSRRTTYRISVYDGEEYALKYNADKATILAAMFSTDHDTLHVTRFDNAEAGVSECRCGWVTFIYGNGCDVIHDYSDNEYSDRLFKPAIDLAERYSNDEII